MVESSQVLFERRSSLHNHLRSYQPYQNHHHEEVEVEILLVHDLLLDVHNSHVLFPYRPILPVDMVGQQELLDAIVPCLGCGSFDGQPRVLLVVVELRWKIDHCDFVGLQ